MPIYGIFQAPAIKNPEGILDRMEKTLNLTYAHKVFKVPVLELGYCSQSIQLDLQFALNERSTKCALMDGEIYDFGKIVDDLRASGHLLKDSRNCVDCVLHGFEEWGSQIFAKLNGVFTAVIFDKETGELTIGNDRCGMNPLFYSWSGGRMTFGSQVKAVTSDPAVSREVDWAAWRDLFSYSYVLGTKTPFKAVRRLPHASILKLKGGELSIQSYWHYDRIKVNHVDPSEYFVENLANLIVQAIKRRTADLKDAIVLLSGGYDSRGIASTIKRHTNVQLETFTTTGPLGFMDTHYAQLVAKKLGVKNTYVPYTLDSYRGGLKQNVILLDGMDIGEFWMLPLLDSLHEGRVNFDGIGGGDMLRGYWDAFLERLFGNKSITNLEQFAYAQHELMKHKAGFDPHTIAGLFRSPIREQLEETHASALAELEPIWTQENRASIFFVTNRLRNDTALVVHNIVARKLKCRLPLLDNDLVTFSFMIPAEMKVEDEIYRKALSVLFPDVMSIPSTNTQLHHPFRDPRNTWRYVVSVVFLRRVWRQLRHNESAAKVTCLRTILRDLNLPSMIDGEKLNATIEEYERKKIDAMPFLLPIVHFLIWYKYFVATQQEEGE